MTIGHPLLGLFLALSILLGAAPARAQHEPSPAGVIGLSVGVHHRSLVEMGPDGRTLVRERGSVPQVRLHWEGGSNARGRWQLQAEASAGELQYVGQTQDGQAARSVTDHREHTLQAAWRAWPQGDAAQPATTHGHWWLGLHFRGRHRAIAGTDFASGLREHATELSPLLRWSSPRLDWGCAAPTPCIESISISAQGSARQRLRVDFLGWLDPLALKGGQRKDLALTVHGRWGEHWRWGLDISRSTQAPSEAATAKLQGFSVGSVMQPRMRVLEHGLWLQRRWQ